MAFSTYIDLVIDGDMTNSVSSYPAMMLYVDNLAIQAAWTGDPTGTLKLQGSVDEGERLGDASIIGVSNWTDLASTTTNVVGTPGTFVWDITSGMRWIRVVYTAASGSGTLQVGCNIKKIKA